MNELKLVLLGIGTLAFFAAVYLSIQHPELVDVPGEKKEGLNNNPLHKWDKAITWLMWGAWGGVAVIIFLDGAGFLEGG